MDSGFYAACTGLAARMQAVDLAANNIANASTGAFRAQYPVFRSILQQTPEGDSLQAVVNNYGIVSATRTDSTAGTIERTGNDFDMALEGPGFFVVQTQAGVRYTRNGRFQLTADGTLTTVQGDRVLGSEGTLQLPAGKLTAGPDGTLSVAGALAGQLRIVEFPPGTELNSLGGTYYGASQQPSAAKSTEVRQGTLEASNVNPVSGAVELMELQRQAETLGRVFSSFHSEFNRTAAEQLPRIQMGG